MTHALWLHVMGSNPAKRPDLRCPVENVSWEQITETGGFLDRINSSEILTALAGPGSALKFRLPAETEWEYAARGGPHWTDGFVFSGSNNPREVAWFGPRWTPARRFVAGLFGLVLRGRSCFLVLSRHKAPQEADLPLSRERRSRFRERV